MSDLMITLGHNSSAIIKERHSTTGYEQERLDKKKGSSAFPVDALEMLDLESRGQDLTDVFVTHWFDQFGRDALRATEDRYFGEHAFRRFGSALAAKFHTHAPDLTHHDCHAWSVVSLYEYERERVPDGALVIVADGFGNFGEVVSTYRWRSGSLRLQRRIYGYESSLGLMYQYATSLCQMKENEDEYKFLGYMNHLRPSRREEALSGGRDLAAFVMQEWQRDRRPRAFVDRRSGGRIDMARLTTARRLWHQRIASATGGLSSYVGTEGRAFVGAVVQEALEVAMSSLVPKDTEHLLVAGGCFMNVRLNDMLSRRVSGSFCAVPLAGDQGAAIGMRRAVKGSGDGFDWSTLAIGTRSFDNAEHNAAVGAGIKWRRSENDVLAEELTDWLTQDKIVCVMRRNMEFGSRALCQTSTLALPTSRNVELINRLNSRNTVMPMAPVMLPSTYEWLFPQYVDKLVGSERFMIAACSASGTEGEEIALVMPGAAHPDPYVEGRWSVRPQVVQNDETMKRVLSCLSSPCLVNTSLNPHGEPILFNARDVIRMKKQWDDRASGSGTDSDKYVFVIVE